MDPAAPVAAEVVVAYSGSITEQEAPGLQNGL